MNQPRYGGAAVSGRRMTPDAEERFPVEKALSPTTARRLKTGGYAAGGAAAVGAVGYSMTPGGQRRIKEGRVATHLARNNSQYRALPRARRKEIAAGILDKYESAQMKAINRTVPEKRPVTKRDNHDLARGTAAGAAAGAGVGTAGAGGLVLHHARKLRIGGMSYKDMNWRPNRTELKVLGTRFALPAAAIGATGGLAAAGANSRGRKKPIQKRVRDYDSEDRRQRRLGMAQAGLLGLGGALAFRGGRGALRSTRAARSIPWAAKDKAGKKELYDALRSGVAISRRDLAYLGGGAAGFGGAGVVRQHAEDPRNRRYL